MTDHNAFYIGFLPQGARESGGDPARGVIRIATFEETFEAAMSYWSRGDYEVHWRESIARILAGDASSCLITSLTHPNSANFLEWWPLYRIDDEVSVQQHLLLFESVSKPFDPSRPCDLVPNLDTSSEEGAPLSTWRVGIQALRDFLDK